MGDTNGFPLVASPCLRVPIVSALLLLLACISVEGFIACNQPTYLIGTKLTWMVIRIYSVVGVAG